MHEVSIIVNKLFDFYFILSSLIVVVHDYQLLVCLYGQHGDAALFFRDQWAANNYYHTKSTHQYLCI